MPRIKVKDNDTMDTLRAATNINPHPPPQRDSLRGDGLKNKVPNPPPQPPSLNANKAKWVASACLPKFCLSSKRHLTNINICSVGGKEGGGSSSRVN